MRIEGYCSRSLCVCVCLSTLICALQATKRPMNDSNGFSTACAQKITWRFCYNDGVRDREIGAVVGMFLDPAHQLAVNMRIMRKSTDLYMRLYPQPVSVSRTQPPHPPGRKSALIRGILADAAFIPRRECMGS